MADHHQLLKPPSIQEPDHHCFPPIKPHASTTQPVPDPCVRVQIHLIPPLQSN
ncbi:formin-like protein 3 isoform X2 [Iris pallida]|uniref:Formin-like protein 3 isoform X2 n=1 Tax=Iris pallida TaxID=29817 RepID=A0AAX6GZ53_IRIPA|nr:formin-like protein 3 isoform X2 [Iris pallida]KAJ6834050.1 formin-like protein 3 isoform X2 [Iris pallida]